MLPFKSQNAIGFRFELSAHRQISLARKKIFRVIDLAALCSRWILCVNRRDAKQFPGAFAIAAGDNGRVYVNEPAFLKEFVDGECQPAAHTKDAAEEIRTRPQMRYLAQEFRRVSLFLQRIGVIRPAHDVDLVRDNFPILSFPLRRDQLATHDNRSARGQMLNGRIVQQRIFRDDLKIAQTRAIVQFDERKIL